MVKKSKRYSAKNVKKEVKEPFRAYQAPLLSALISMSYNDISEAHLSGQSLVDIQNQTSLSVQNLASIIGVSKSKYYDLIGSDDLGVKNIDALVDFATLWQTGLNAFDGDAALLKEWLDSRNTNLGEIRPIELLSTRVGRRTLEKALLRIEYSTYG